MTYGVDFEHQIPCPARIGPKETGPIDAAGIWRSVWSIEGWWSNVDIYLDAPASWGAALTDVHLRLFAVTSAGRTLVAQTTVSAASLEVLSDGSFRGIVLAGRGHPASGWLLEAMRPVIGGGVLSATIIGELWGTESTPDGIGRRAATGIVDRSFPSRGSHLLGWPGDIPIGAGPGGPWLPVAVDPVTAHLIVDAVVVVPPLVVGEVSRFQDLGTLAGAALTAAPGRVFSASAENISGPAKFFQLHNKIAAPVLGDVPFFTLQVPSSGTVIIGSDFFGVPFASSPLLGGLFFSLGIAWGWSTTRATYTAAPVATQATHILFV